MTPDTVADGAERRVGEVNERQGDLSEKGEGRGEDRTVRTRFGAERVGKWRRWRERGAQQPVLDDTATTTSPMLQWISSEDTFSFAVPIRAISFPLYYPFPFVLFIFLLFSFSFLFLLATRRNGDDDIDAQLRGYRDESQAPAAEEKAAC